MDIAQQVLKHLPRDARATVPLIDAYCQSYRNLFPEVRNYECFKELHLGLMSSIKRKSLPEIAKVVPHQSSQSLHHFLTNSPWQVSDLRSRRLEHTLKAVQNKKLVVVIDETGDRKKGNKTDYVARQYLGSVGKVDQGIVSVNAYGFCNDITFPLLCKVFKPKGTLKENDIYKTKPKIASEIIEELIDVGFKIHLVLGDSLYGESSEFINTLEKHNLNWLLSIRSNHGVWMPPGSRFRENRWCSFERRFTRNKPETRYIREIIFGKRGRCTYWQLTTDPIKLPSQSTSFVMTNLQEKRSKQKKTIGNLYGLRTWVEYGFRQCKQELGWKDYRLTSFPSIEKWWEIIFCVYLMVSLNAGGPEASEQSPCDDGVRDEPLEDTAIKNRHQYWSAEHGWKTTLNNLRLMIEPTVMLCLISPWLSLFPNRSLVTGFHRLIDQVSQYSLPYWSG